MFAQLGLRGVIGRVCKRVPGFRGLGSRGLGFEGGFWFCICGFH